MACDQLFCKPMDMHELRAFLDKITHATNGSYLIGYHAFKKLVFHELHTEFRDLLRPYYHKSKQYYIERDLSYKSFITIIRQVCKYNGIQITSRVRYVESNYTNEYTVFMENLP